MTRRSEHTLDTGEVQLNYAETGTGDSFIALLHGLAARWQVFGPVLPALASRWHVLAPDLRGHGRSGRAAGRYTIPDFVRDVLALLDAHHIERAVVWGHSLGGWVALTLAAMAPQRVRGLVVGDTAIYPQGIAAEAAISYLADLPLALRSLATSLQQLDPEVMKAFRGRRMVDGYDADVLLGEIACPTLLLQADPDRGGLMTDQDVTSALARLHRGAHVRMDGIGHGLHVEDGAAVLDVVLPFLEVLGAPGAGGPEP